MGSLPVRFSAVVLAAAVIILSGSARADFDGRIPFARSMPLRGSPETFPPEAKGFLEQSGIAADIYWDPLLNTPRYVSMRSKVVLGEVEYPEGLVEGANAFVDRNAEFFGVHSFDLIGGKVSHVDKDKLLLFRQSVGGLPIRGSSLRILVREDGSIRSIKAFLIRNPAAAQDWDVVPFEGIQALLDSWNYRVQVAEKQIFFPRFEVASMRPVWCVLAADTEEKPWEIFFDSGTGQPLEKREVIAHLDDTGTIYGDATGAYPRPEDLSASFIDIPKDANGAYVHIPISGATVMEALGSRIEIAISDDQGGYQLNVPKRADPTETILRCDTQYGRFGPKEEAPYFAKDLNGSPDDFHSILNVFETPDSCSFAQTPDVIESYRVHLNSGKVAPDSSWFFYFEKYSHLSQFPSTSFPLMTFNHARKFLSDSLDRMQETNLDPETKPFPLSIVCLTGIDGLDDLLDREKYRSEYFTNPDHPKICISAALAEGQFVTANVIKHEVAHHALFVITGALRSYGFDCLNAEDGTPCTFKLNLPSYAIEENMMEGVVDALAAIHSANPVFGSNRPFYDISNVEQMRAKTNPERAEIAKALWDMFFSMQGKPGGEKACNEIIYKWLGTMKTLAPWDRLMDGSASMYQEILDVMTVEQHAFFDTVIAKAFMGRQFFFFYAPFIRGDADQSLAIDLSDAVFILSYLFYAGPGEKCLDAMDVDVDGGVSITDAVSLLSYLFMGGSPPTAPFPACGLDPAPASNILTCKVSACP